MMTVHNKNTIGEPQTNAIVIKPKSNQVDTWLHLKRLFVKKRDSDAGRNGKAIPRTTNSDVRQLADYWHRAMERAEMATFFKPDKDKASRRRWLANKQTIDAQLRHAEPNAIYPHNEWFWQDASYRAASYLDALAFLPSHVQLLGESVKETLAERKRDIADAFDKSDELIGWLKKGAWIVGGLVATAVVVPPVIRALRADD